MASDFVPKFIVGVIATLFIALIFWDIFLKRGPTPEEKRQKIENIKEVMQREVNRIKAYLAEAEAKEEAAKERKLDKIKKELAQAEKEVLNVNEDVSDFYETLDHDDTDANVSSTLVTIRMTGRRMCLCGSTGALGSLRSIIKSMEAVVEVES